MRRDEEREWEEGKDREREKEYVLDFAYERAEGARGEEGKDPCTMRAPWNKRALSPQKEKQAYSS